MTTANGLRCFGAASAKDRLDVVIRDAINAGDIPGPRYLANGKEMARRVCTIINYSVQKLPTLRYWKSFCRMLLPLPCICLYLQK
jgi:hypothetical protein